MIVQNGFVARAVLATAVLVTVALVSFTPAARASTYDFSGVGVDLDITTGAPDNGGFDITNVTGTVLGVPVTLAGGDPGAGGAISPDGLFIYDNILYLSSNPVFDIDGLLVQIGQDSYANLWGNGSANSYSLYTSANGGYPVQNGSYTGILTATPLPSTWTMLIVGFVGLGFIAYRGTKKATAALSAA
jgi:hypothetical protein